MTAELHSVTEHEHDERESRVTVLLPRREGVPGRPPVHTEPWHKVTVVMEEHHVLYLDLISLFIRARHPGVAVSRAELVRALIEFMERSEFDFSDFSSAEEITENLVSYFRALPKPETPLPLLNSGLFSNARAPKRHVLLAGRKRAGVIGENE